MKVMLAKAGGALVPVDQQGVELLAKLKTGAGVSCEIKRARNVGHHRKLFALLNFAFDAWEPAAQQYKGQPVQKNFDRFRSDIVILAGFFEATIAINGETRLAAKSISFANMGQDEFDGLYEKVITVVMHKILTNYQREDLDNIIEQLLQFT
jgi:hypothetical protein